MNLLKFVHFQKYFVFYFIWCRQDTRSEEGRNVPVKNIDAAQELTNIIRTNLGPNGSTRFI